MEHQRIALVTGATGDIGAAICRRLAQGGVTVAVGYRREEETARQLAGEIGGLPVFCDVADPASVRQAVRRVLAEFSRLDILVCNAGVAWRGLLQDMSDEEWRAVMATDLDGVFFCCREVLPQMIRQKSGKILTISSVWGVRGASCEAAYSAAKAGVIGLTRALAQEVGPSGIQVNCLAPGVIATRMNQNLSPQDLAALAEDTPLGRIGTPEEIAQAAEFLCSPAGDFITGQVLGVDGGFGL